MAEEVTLAETEARAKLRNPLGVVGLSIITLGIYYVFWWYFINREMRDFGRARGVDLGQSPGNSVLALTLGALIIVPALVTLWTTTDRIQRTQETAGVDRPANGPIIFVLLLVIGPVGIWYAQRELNKAWRRARRPQLPPRISRLPPSRVPRRRATDRRLRASRGRPPRAPGGPGRSP